LLRSSKGGSRLRCVYAIRSSARSPPGPLSYSRVLPFTGANQRHTNLRETQALSRMMDRRLVEVLRPCPSRTGFCRPAGLDWFPSDRPAVPRRAGMTAVRASVSAAVAAFDECSLLISYFPIFIFRAIGAMPFSAASPRSVRPLPQDFYWHGDDAWSSQMLSTLFFVDQSFRDRSDWRIRCPDL